MKMKCRKPITSFILCMALTVAMALITTGCGDRAKGTASTAGTAPAIGTAPATGTETPSLTGTETPVAADSDGNVQIDDIRPEVHVLGEGSSEFLFTVVDMEGNESNYEIHTDKEKVGEALTELQLIEGEKSQYGLFVKTVTGVTADYDKDGAYWAFYVNGEYAQTGVDATKITEGDSYSFRLEKS